MLGFVRRYSVPVSSGCCLFVSLLLLSANRHASERVDPLGRVFLELVSPLQKGATMAGRAVGHLYRDYRELVRVREENRSLRRRVAELERELVREREVELANRRLRRLLDFRKRIGAEVIAAQVVGRDASGLFRTLTIDRGERDGVYKGAAVLAPAGVVGQVYMASSHAARVLLVTDHNSGVDVLVQRTRVRGIVAGVVDDGCELKYVPRTADVRAGDLLITSGLGAVFPKGVPVGEVRTVERRARGMFARVMVEPRVDFAELEEVLVTRGGPGGAAAPAAEGVP